MMIEYLYSTHHYFTLSLRCWVYVSVSQPGNMKVGAQLTLGDVTPITESNTLRNEQQK